MRKKKSIAREEAIREADKKISDERTSGKKATDFHDARDKADEGKRAQK